MRKNQGQLTTKNAKDTKKLEEIKEADAGGLTTDFVNSALLYLKFFAACANFPKGDHCPTKFNFICRAKPLSALPRDGQRSALLSSDHSDNFSRICWSVGRRSTRPMRRCGPGLSGCLANAGCPIAFVPITARRLPPWLWAASVSCRSGGSNWVSALSGVISLTSFSLHEAPNLILLHQLFTVNSLTCHPSLNSTE